jgi:hypothetical protein
LPELAKVTTPPESEQTVPSPVVIEKDTAKPDVEVAVGV